MAFTREMVPDLIQEITETLQSIDTQLQSARYNLRDIRHDFQSVLFQIGTGMMLLGEYVEQQSIQVIADKATGENDPDKLQALVFEASDKINAIQSRFIQ